MITAIKESVSTCPKYTGSGAKAGESTCQFFTSVDAHPEVKWFCIAALLTLAFFCIRYLNTGKVLLGVLSVQPHQP